MAASAGRRKLQQSPVNLQGLQKSPLSFLAENFLTQMNTQTTENDDGPSEPNLDDYPEPGVNTTTLLLQMSKDMKSLMSQVSNISEKLDHSIEKVDDQDKKIDALQEKNSELEREVEQLKNEVVTVKSQLSNQQKKITTLELYQRRENLIFNGVPSDANERCAEKIKSILQNNMGLLDADSIKFDRCHRMNSKTQPPPIICSFNWSVDRNRVWSAKSKLKGSKFSISEDFPKEINIRRKSLYPIMITAKKLGMNSYLNVDRLIINGSTYTVDNLHTLPANLDPAKVSTRKVGDVTAFFSKASPLSNFFPADFDFKGRKYPHVEQCLQHQKAEFAENVEIARKILKTQNPAECKQLGDSITVKDNEWFPHARETLVQACRAKFRENERARNFLLDTENTVLAEASKNETYGIGMTLNSKTIGDQATWTGRNELGKILMQIRTELQ